MPDDDLWYGTSGPHDASIVIVGEAWGAEEFLAKVPFVGGSGTELTRMLAEAGIDRSQCLLTNLIPQRPPNNDMRVYFHATEDAPPGSEVRKLHPLPGLVESLARLYRQIAHAPRKLVIGTGNYPLWAFTNCAGYDTDVIDDRHYRSPNGIMSWRGSMWQCEIGESRPKFLPIIHPAAILRQWENRAVTVHDLKARVPLALKGDWRPHPAPVFWAPPSFEEAQLKLTHWIDRAEGGERFRLVCDIETNRRIITCIGFADSPHFAMAIPFVADGKLTDYWTHDQEVRLIDKMRRLLSHPNTLVEGQNFLYDTQYIYAYLAVLPRCDADSMLMHHLLWPGTTKDLGYLSSLYCHYHWYWKEDGKEWNGKGSISDLLKYNCLDVIRTFEAITVLRDLIPRMNMSAQWEETKQRQSLALRMMLKGVRVDRDRRARVGRELAEAYERIGHELATIIPQSWLPAPKKGAKPVPWYRSPAQQQYVFGEILGFKIPKSRKTGRPTLGYEALMELPKQMPEFTGIFKRIEDLRSVGVFKSHFIDAPLDFDDRIRCSFNPAGTETFRFNSSKNAFGSGTNLQNIPAGEED